MKDKIIKLDSKREFYILDELTIKNRKFVLGIECDSKEETLKNNYIIREVTLKDEKLFTKDILDEDEGKYVASVFLENLNKRISN